MKFLNRMLVLGLSILMLSMPMAAEAKFGGGFRAAPSFRSTPTFRSTPRMAPAPTVTTRPTYTPSKPSTPSAAPSTSSSSSFMSSFMGSMMGYWVVQSLFGDKDDKEKAEQTDEDPNAE